MKGLFMIRTYKGELYYANLKSTVGSEQKGLRPVLVLQNNKGNKYSPTIIVAPVTSKVLSKAKIPTHVDIEPFEKLKYESMVLIEQLRVIDKKRLKSYLGKIDNEKLHQVDKAIIKAFNINIKNVMKSTEKSNVQK